MRRFHAVALRRNRGPCTYLVWGLLPFSSLLFFRYPSEKRKIQNTIQRRISKLKKK